jgi:hypothetical protein
LASSFFNFAFFSFFLGTFSSSLSSSSLDESASPLVGCALAATGTAAAYLALLGAAAFESWAPYASSDTSDISSSSSSTTSPLRALISFYLVGM